MNDRSMPARNSSSINLVVKTTRSKHGKARGPGISKAMLAKDDGMNACNFFSFGGEIRPAVSFPVALLCLI